MTTQPRRHRMLCTLVLLALLAGAAIVATPSVVQAAETPRRGGVLLAVIGADPPSLDPHQESTFANIELVAPLYSTCFSSTPITTRKSSVTWRLSGRLRPTD